MLNGQYINMSVNGALKIGGYESMIIKPWFGLCYA